MNFKRIGIIAAAAVFLAAFVILTAYQQFAAISHTLAIRNITRLLFDKVTLACQFPQVNTSSETQNAEWSKDGAVLNSTSSSRIKVQVRGNATILTIHQIEKSDAGLYQCNIINDSDERKSSDLIYLNVEYPAEVLETTASKQIHLQSGRRGLIPCNIDSNPPINFVMWVQNRRFLEVTESDKYEPLGNGSLVINSVEESDGGTYTCTPYNIHGTKGASFPMDVIVRNSEMD